MNDNPTLELIYRGVTFSVRFDRWDELQPGRAHWAYHVEAPGRRFSIDSGTDLTTVHNPNTTDVGPYTKALASLLTFYAGNPEDCYAGLHEASGLDSDDLYLLAEQIECTGD